MSEAAFRCGLVAIVGRPNVGKSTLLNRLVGEKISITSSRPQTTRHAIRGILTTAAAQFVFVDTPGFQTVHRNALQRAMNRGVTRTLHDVDAVVWVLEAGRFTAADAALLRLLPGGRPVIAALNKIDTLRDKRSLLPFIARLAPRFDFAAIIPISAEQDDGIGELLTATAGLLAEREPMFAADELTDRSERFLAAEFLREKLFRRLGQELPYATTVDIERFSDEGGLRRIHAVVIVDKPSHKAIVIGRNGAQLKAMASAARIDLERLLGAKVFLEVWVKVRGGWADDQRALQALGYE